MQRFKVCMLGAPAVGKTSLVKRFVEGRFDEGYLKTLGVKVDRHHVLTKAGLAALLIWDIYGDEPDLPASQRHLRGMAGALLVVDATRLETVATADEVWHKAVEAGFDCPYVVAVNKSDLCDDLGSLRSEMMNSFGDLVAGAAAVVDTSALAGTHVETAFVCLGDALVG